MTDPIRAERLDLRPIRLEDAGPMTLYCADERVARMTSSIPHPYPPGCAEAFIDAVLTGRHAEDVWVMDGSRAGWADVIGVVSLKRAKRELGYWVGPPFWNTGFASEAVQAVTAHLLGKRGLDRLHATVFADNPASAQVLLKAGYRETGTGEGYSLSRDAMVPVRLFECGRDDLAVLSTMPEHGQVRPGGGSVA